MLQVSFVGMTEEQARAKAEEGGWADRVAVQKTSFKANSKALAEKESEGMAKMIYRCSLSYVHSWQPGCSWCAGLLPSYIKAQGELS